VPAAISSDPLPRSSIAAVVRKRVALGLSDEQVRQLELIDQDREKVCASILEDAAAKRKLAAAPAPSPASSGGGNSGGGASSGGMRGGGMRGGGGGGRRPPEGARHPGVDESKVEDRLDEADTKAYTDAEDVLTEEQREAAREVASEYREQLYERREQARAK
jgi:hypothetical protein